MAMYKRCENCSKKIEYGKKCKCTEDKKKERYKAYDKDVRYAKDNIKYARFYNSKHWKRLVEYVKNKYNGVCLACLLEEQEINACDVLHHIVPIKLCWNKRLEESNLIPLCHIHHNLIDHKDVSKGATRRLESLLELYKERYV